MNSDLRSRCRPATLVALSAILAWGAGATAFAGIALDLAWHVKPGDRPWVTFDNLERGMGYRAASGNVLVVGRAGSPTIYAIAGADGADQHTLDLTGVSGGLFTLNKLAVAEDGAVYAANLTLNAGTSTFRIYRWSDDAPGTAPVIAYEGDPGALGGAPGQRWGDSLAVRGSGAGTQILAGSNTSGSVALFTTSDGENFTPTYFSGVGDAEGIIGLAFGAGDTFYTKKFSATIRLATFDLMNGTATTQNLASAGPEDAAIRVLGTGLSDSYFGTITVNRTPAALGTEPDTFTVWNITNPTVRSLEASASITIDTLVGVPYDSDNLNGGGAIAFAPNAVFVLNTNNGIMRFDITVTGVNPPVIQTPPTGIAILEGGLTTLSVVASGDQPLTYQWTRNAMDLPNANASTLELGPVTSADAATYAVRVGNTAGSATSADAVVTVLPRDDTAVASPKWTVPAGSRAYLSTGGRTHRGMDVNPSNGNLIAVSRELGSRVYVLDGTTGADLRELDTTGVTGGTFAINMVGVADDGVVYAGNLTTDGAASAFRLYRWDNDAGGVAPFASFAADPANGTNPQRWGDTMDVRGSGVNTQILLASRTGSILAVLTTPDGFNFNALPVQTDGAAGDFGLGVAFGEGNSAWGTASGRGLRHVALDLNAGTATTLRFHPTTEFPGGSTALAVDTDLKCLAALVLDTPNTLQLFDISNPAIPPVRLDQELFNGGRVNVNTDGTGAVAFGNGTVYGLATNNGLIALDSTKTAPIRMPVIGPVTFAEPDEYLFTVTGEPGASFQVEISPNLSTWSNGPSGVLDQDGEARIVLPLVDPAGGFARVIQTVNP